MERTLIRYVLRNKHTKQLAFKTYYIEQIEAGGIEKLFDIENYTVVSRDRFTGLTDKNGAKIFEGDVLTHTVVADIKRKGEVHSNYVDFYENHWRIGNGRFRRQLTKNWIYNQKSIITGNIHE